MAAGPGPARRATSRFRAASTSRSCSGRGRPAWPARSAGSTAGPLRAGDGSRSLTRVRGTNRPGRARPGRTSTPADRPGHRRQPRPARHASSACCRARDRARRARPARRGGSRSAATASASGSDGEPLPEGVGGETPHPRRAVGRGPGPARRPADRPSASTTRRRAAIAWSAVVIAADLPVLGQLRPGDEVRSRGDGRGQRPSIAPARAAGPARCAARRAPRGSRLGTTSPGSAGG